MNSKNKYNFRVMDSNGDEQEVYYYGIDPRKIHSLINSMRQFDEVEKPDGTKEIVINKTYGDESYGWAETIKPKLTELLADAYYEKNPSTLTHEAVMDDICIDNMSLNTFLYGGKDFQGYIQFCREQRIRLVRKS